MQRLIYYIALPFLYFISVLPFPILYAISDFFYFLLYKVVGYRKQVVRLNIQRSFPQMPLEEVIENEKKFFRNLTDIMLETIKCITISKKDILNHVSFKDSEVLKKVIGKNVICTAGHCGNYELVAQFIGAVHNTPQFPFYGKAVYKPLSNPFFEKLFYNFRTKNGAILYPIKQTKEAFLQQSKDTPFVFFLINDQSAPPEKAYITQFLNQETAFFKGPETYSKMYDMPVIFMSIEKPSRGKYELSVKELTLSPAMEAENVILEKHARLLEKDIEANIPNWLWSHKRWKFKKVDGKYVDVNYKK